MFNRRQFMGTAVASAAVYAAGSFTPMWAQNAPNFGTPTLPSPGFRRLKVGNVEVIALLDGITRRPLGEEFVANAPLADVRALLTSQSLSPDYVDVPYTPFLVVAGNRRVLMDTGLGEFGGPTTGKLLENLAAAGFKPDDIDTVLVSHYHGDHINGIRNKAGDFVFSKAKVMVPAAEHAFWMDEARAAAAAGGRMKGLFDNVRRTFVGMPEGMLQQFQPGQELLPGVRSVAAHGHTPGMSMFEITSGGQVFTFLADLTNIPALFARNPDFAITFDMDPVMARQTRRATFERIVASKGLVGGFHFPFPALGQMVAAGNGYSFQAA